MICTLAQHEVSHSIVINIMQNSVNYQLKLVEPTE